MTIYRIVATHFVAAAITDDDQVVVQAAPILGWSVGKPFAELRDYAAGKGWTVQPIPVEKAKPDERYDPRTYRTSDGTKYELLFLESEIVRITKTTPTGRSSEISYAKLPLSVRNILESEE